MSKICTLCLKQIGEEQSIVIDERLRHLVCHKQLEKMVADLEEIYEGTKPEESK